MLYDSVSKRMHRVQVMELHHLDTSKKPVLYLDDETHGATRFFQERGIPTSKLVPVNWDEEVCKELSESTGAKAVHDHIHEVVKRARPRSYSVVWLDLMTRSVGKDTVRLSLRSAKFVAVTFSLRGSKGEEAMKSIHSACRAEGAVLHNVPLRYKARSGIKNMAYVVLEARTPSLSDAKSSREKKKSSHREEGKSKKGNKSATPTMTNPPSSSFPSPTIRKKRDTPLSRLSAVSYVGKYVCIPRSEFEDPEDGSYIKDGCLCFYVEKTYHKYRLTLRRVLAGKEMDTLLEPWTLTPSDMRKFKVLRMLR